MIKPLGDSALLVELGDEINPAINQRVHALNALLQANIIAGVIETVPAYCTLLIHYEPELLMFTQVELWAESQLARLSDSFERKARWIEVPVKYNGIDLESIAATKGISIADVIQIHSGREYAVYMMGFTPGFPYMGILDDRLVMPRLENPRTLVRAGTVAIAGSQTGIYPLDSPGGWHLLGWTPLKLFDPMSDNPFLFSPGDTVKFIPIEDNHA
jgi:KipI family sensor histidine kinase inhibitor